MALLCHLHPRGPEGTRLEMGYGADRTFTAEQWRVVVSTAGGILAAGVGLGVLIGRLTAPVPEPPPVSATILPDVLPAPSLATATPTTAPAAASVDDDSDAPDQPQASAPPAPPRPVPSPPAPVRTVQAVPAPVKTPAVKAPSVQKVPPRPEHVAAPKRAEPKTKAEPAPLPEPEAADAAGPRWAVQLGAFRSSDHANLLVMTLAAHGQPAHVTYTQNAAGEGWFYVQTPPYRSAAAAKSAAQGLAAREHVPTYLIKLSDAD